MQKCHRSAFLHFCSHFKKIKKNVTKTDSWAFLFTRLCSQIFQATVDYQLWRHHGNLLPFGLSDIPLLAWLLVSLSLMLVVVLNEVVKLHEIRYECSHETKLKCMSICGRLTIANWLDLSSQWVCNYLTELRALIWSHWSF